MAVPKNYGAGLTDRNLFSDFERNWYIERGFGDPTRTETKYFDRANQEIKLGQPPRNYQGYSKNGNFTPATFRSAGNPFMLGLGIQARQVTAGVSPEARQLFLMAMGGKDPINLDAANVGTMPRTVVQGSAGIGTISNLPTTATTNVPVLEDPNQGRSGLRIRRMN